MKSIFWMLLLFVGISCASAQDVYTSSGKPGYYKKTKKVKGFDPSKLIIGGGLNASYSNDYVSVGISPLVGYKITDQFSAGIGLGYQYYKFVSYVDQYYNAYYSSQNIIYPSIWGRYFVFRNFFVDATLEEDFIYQTDPLDQYGNFNATKSTFTVPCLLMGVGVNFPIAGRVSLFAEVMYDVLQDPNSPYYGQIVPRAGICAGL